MQEKKKRLVLVDGHSVLFRAYHAYPPLTTSKGELVNAVYGFSNILLSVIGELSPTHLAVTFDREKPTFRHTEYVGYKAQREEMPTELASQQARVEEVVQALNIPIFAVEGFEADDVIGTLVNQAKSKIKNQKSKIDEVVIVTGDNDVLQLVDDDQRVKVRVYVPGRGKRPAMLYDEKEVEKKYEGLQPEQIPDLKGLAGDASDNIPGVRGVGPKTAIGLLLAHKSVEVLYEALRRPGSSHRSRLAQGDKVDLKSLSTSSNEVGLSELLIEKLIEGYESAILSKKLATISRDVPIELKLKACEVNDYDKSRAMTLFEELEFRSLIKKLPNDSFEQAVQETLL